jgi:hypothetical protein
MVVSACYRDPFEWHCRDGGVLPLGVERSPTSNCATCVWTKLTLTIPDHSFLVYIFRHSTVTGVYITMFIK